MKKYIVIKKLSSFNADEVRQFDNLDDARCFKNLLASSESGNWNYYVVEVLE